VKLLVKLGGTLLDAAASRDALSAQISRARSGGHEITVVHGGGKQMTRYLADRGIESRFVEFPDEGHWILKPANSNYWYATVLDWLEAHTR